MQQLQQQQHPQTASNHSVSTSVGLPATPEPSHGDPHPVLSSIGSVVPYFPDHVPPTPSDYGAMRLQRSGSSYVGAAHWEAVLGSIAQLREHLESDGEAKVSSPDIFQMQQNSGSGSDRPKLLYGNTRHASIDSILDAIPARSTVDRLVHRYFNGLDMATGKV
jgi:hypothetical protein